MPQRRRNFSTRSLKRLRELHLAGEPAVLSPELGRVAGDLGIGRPVKGRGDERRRSVSVSDLSALVEFARRDTGWDFVAELDGDRRTAAALDDEKQGGRRAFGGMLLYRWIGDVAPGAHVTTARYAALQRPDAVLVVENAAAVMHLQSVPLELPDSYATERVLAVYRGGPGLSPRTVLDLLASIPVPVDSFPDLDPSGLSIAAALPRVRHIVLPPRARWPSRRRINYDRFQRQCERVDLAAMRSPATGFDEAIRWLRANESAVPQEYWVSDSD